MKLTPKQHSQLFKDRLMYLHVLKVVEREERYNTKENYTHDLLNWTPPKREKMKYSFFGLIASNF